MTLARQIGLLTAGANPAVKTYSGASGAAAREGRFLDQQDAAAITLLDAVDASRVFLGHSGSAAFAKRMVLESL
ncbi:hypothetical protein GCM10011399_09790 [Subtercola lobariae]|uniref:Uncharacterized protein n=1 Tax=Subtercola lobariae TaxID=1588641 RepID=A0A917EUI7_9MICO|nr:hypothetical protein GCM10011399_09790 [Subtercola lobariae]